VRIEAEMKTPNSTAVTKLDLSPNTTTTSTTADTSAAAQPHGKAGGVDLEPGRTLQRIVNFDLKEEGNHVLGVTVSYYEATDTSGRTRTFRKLYQFICKPSLIVRTKASPLAPAVKPKASSPPQPSLAAGPPPRPEGTEDVSAPGVVGAREDKAMEGKRRRWVLEAQLENCSEDTTELERVVLQLEPRLSYRDCNWEAGGSPRPVLHPGEVEQVCFVIEEDSPVDGPGIEEQDGKILLGILGIGWRTEMGQRGYLATNKLGTRHIT
jgi:trafficking protein particle complex subunit 13